MSLKDLLKNIIKVGYRKIYKRFYYLGKYYLISLRLSNTFNLFRTSLKFISPTYLHNTRGTIFFITYSKIYYMKYWMK